jgi:hypothetical protein
MEFSFRTGAAVKFRPLPQSVPQKKLEHPEKNGLGKIIIKHYCAKKTIKILKREKT